MGERPSQNDENGVWNFPLRKKYMPFVQYFLKEYKKKSQKRLHGNILANCYTKAEFGETQLAGTEGKCNELPIWWAWAWPTGGLADSWGGPEDHP